MRHHSADKDNENLETDEAQRAKIFPPLPFFSLFFALHPPFPLTPVCPNNQRAPLTPVCPNNQRALKTRVTDFGRSIPFPSLRVLPKAPSSRVPPNPNVIEIWPVNQFLTRLWTRKVIWKPPLSPLPFLPITNTPIAECSAMGVLRK